MPMKTLLLTLTFLLATAVGVAEEWVFRVHRDSIRMVSASGMEKPNWFLDVHGIRNMTNLSFFTGSTFIPPYKDALHLDLKNPHGWPYFCIGDSCVVREKGEGGLTGEFIVAGYPLLVKAGRPNKIKRSFFTRRVCPRTAIGVDSLGQVVIFITTAANLKTVQRRMLELGVLDALNLDGGSSTFLYLDGKRIYSSRQARTYPNVLAW